MTISVTNNTGGDIFSHNVVNPAVNGYGTFPVGYYIISTYNCTTFSIASSSVLNGLTLTTLYTVGNFVIYGCYLSSTISGYMAFNATTNASINSGYGAVIFDVVINCPVSFPVVQFNEYYNSNLTGTYPINETVNLASAFHNTANVTYLITYNTKNPHVTPTGFTDLSGFINNMNTYWSSTQYTSVVFAENPGLVLSLVMEIGISDIKINITEQSYTIIEKPVQIDAQFDISTTRIIYSYTNNPVQIQVGFNVSKMSYALIYNYVTIPIQIVKQSYVITEDTVQTDFQKNLYTTAPSYFISYDPVQKDSAWVVSLNAQQYLITDNIVVPQFVYGISEWNYTRFVYPAQIDPQKDIGIPFYNYSFTTKSIIVDEQQWISIDNSLVYGHSFSYPVDVTNDIFTDLMIYQIIGEFVGYNSIESLSAWTYIITDNPVDISTNLFMNEQNYVITEDIVQIDPQFDIEIIETGYALIFDTIQQTLIVPINEQNYVWTIKPLTVYGNRVEINPLAIEYDITVHDVFVDAQTENDINVWSYPITFNSIQTDLEKAILVSELNYTSASFPVQIGRASCRERVSSPV